MQLFFKNAIDNSYQSPEAYSSTLKEKLRPYDFTVPDIGSAYCFTAFALVCTNIDQADKDDVFQDFKRSFNPHTESTRKLRSDPKNENSNTPPQPTSQTVSLSDKSIVPSEIRSFATPSLSDYHLTPRASTTTNNYQIQSQTINDVGQHETANIMENAIFQKSPNPPPKKRKKRMGEHSSMKPNKKARVDEKEKEPNDPADSKPQQKVYTEAAADSINSSMHSTKNRK